MSCLDACVLGLRGVAERARTKSEALYSSRSSTISVANDIVDVCGA